MKTAGPAIEAGPDSQALVRAARALAPQIEAAGDQIQRDRRLPPSVVGALTDAGLFRMLVPRSLGGAEASLPTFAAVVEEIAGADGSTGWCLCQGAVAAMVSAFLPLPAAREIFGEPKTIVAWGPGPTSTARVVAGGYRLTGQWSFASGCHHASWLGGACALINEGGAPLLGEDGAPRRRLLMLPAAEAEIIDVWDVSGLRGTGSDTYRVENLFVPAEHAVAVPLPAPHEPGPLYLFVGGPSFVGAFAVGFAAVALGLARSTLDALVALAATKTPRGVKGVLREQPMVQAHVGQAEATLRSARAFLHQTLAEVWEAVCRTHELTLEQRVWIRLATTHAIQRGAEVVDVAYHAAGSTAIFASNPFERRFRDVHAVMQQLQGRQEHYETAGQYIMGLAPDREWL